MARYPTFDEYATTGKFPEGIKRCDELLKRSPNDTTLLITKLQLQGALEQDVIPTLETLLALQPPVSEFRELVSIEAAIVNSRRNIYPQPLTAGPLISKLWENAFKASNASKYKTSLLEVRFDRAVTDHRIQDVQQTLITFKSFQPKNRAIYMAHAAYTQLLSQDKDDLQSRLAIGLARKAVSEKFDEDKALDCRVPGQIFVIQGSDKDLEAIRNRPFGESQQVYKKLKTNELAASNGIAKLNLNDDPANMPTREWLYAEITHLESDFKDCITSQAGSDVLIKFAANAARLFHTSITSLDLDGRDRGAAESCFLAISALTKVFEDTTNAAYLLQSACLAEQLLNHNSHIHEARLILVYLYMRLNLGSQATRLFDSLSVKEIQHDTVGHALYSRLSVLHPSIIQLSSGKDFEPHDKTRGALAVYPRHEDKLSETEAEILHHYQTGMIFDLQELRVNLRDSLPRRLFLLEHRRITRLMGKVLGKNTNDIGPKVVANWVNTKDNRDFNATFNYGFNVEEALYTDSTSTPEKLTLLHDLAIDTAWSLATSQRSLINDFDNLAPAIAKLSTTDVSVKGRAQHLASQIALVLITFLRSNNTPSQATTASLLSQLQALPISSFSKTSDILAENLPDHYILLDILLIVQQACRTTIVDDSAEILALCANAIKALQQHAVEQGVAVRPATVKELMMQTRDEELNTALRLFGEDGLDAFVEMIVASAKEGWESIRKVVLDS